jgi:hypothetical protein
LTVVTVGVTPAGAAPSPWTTDSSIQATIYESSGSYAAPLITSAEIEQNVDVAFPQGGGPWTGMSVKRLSELLGVAPMSLATTTAMAVTSPDGAGTLGISQSQVASGYPHSAEPTVYAVFEVANASFPADDNDGFFDPEAYDAGFEPDAPGGLFPVDVYVNGTVLGVPEPVFTVCTPGVGQSVGFSLPPGGVVTLGQQPGSPADANGLTYSWDFGDGSPPTPFAASSSTSYPFAAQGTFDVRVTAEDAAGNAGVSPVAAQVVVGPTQGTPGPCGTVPGQSSTQAGHNASRPGPSTDTGGSNSSGGGTNAGAALSSGAASGSVHPPTTHVAARKTGARPSIPPDASSSGAGSSLSGGAGPGAAAAAAVATAGAPPAGAARGRVLRVRLAAAARLRAASPPARASPAPARVGRSWPSAPLAGARWPRAA